MHVNDKLRLLEVLTRIGSEEPTAIKCGICSNVQDAIGWVGQWWLAKGFSDWPESKGTHYPVEGDSQIYARSRESRWDVSTEYGARRYRLLAWLIHKLTKEIRAELSL